MPHTPRWTAPSATYEVHLQDTPPEISRRFAPTRVASDAGPDRADAPVSSQDELATLLERVLALGLVLNEVHELRVASRPPSATRRVAGERTVYRAYEVRIDGQLDGDSSASCAGTTATCPSMRR